MLLFTLSVTLMLLYISYTDIRTHRIPDIAILALAFAYLCENLGYDYSVNTHLVDLSRNHMFPLFYNVSQRLFFLYIKTQPLLSCLATSVIFIALKCVFDHVRKTTTFGWGDIKLAAVLSLWIPLADLPFFYMGIGFAGLITGLCFHGQRGIEKEIPCAPSISSAFLLIHLIHHG